MTSKIPTKPLLMLCILLATLVFMSPSFSQPLVDVGSGVTVAGDTVTVDIQFDGGDLDISAVDFEIGFPTEFLTFESCSALLAEGISAACRDQPGRVTFLGFSFFLEALPNGFIGRVTFRVTQDLPGPATILLSILSENYSDTQAQVIDPSGDSSGGFVRVIAPGEPNAVDRFEDDDTPLSARASDSSMIRSDSHAFDSDTDEDWVLVDMGQGTFQFDVCNGMCGDGGEITPNVQVFGPDRIIDENAIPLAEYNQCDQGGGPPPGTEVVGAEPPVLPDNQVYLLRIRDCYGLHGPEFPYDLFMNVETVDQQAAMITGNVTAGEASVPIGAFLFVSSSQVTATNPADGAYGTVVDPGEDLEVTIMSGSAQTQTFMVPALAPMEVRTVDLRVIANLVFTDGFE
ncbi:MAG: cohesin domain-containing protein [Pseudomonadota bacterium]